ncbi:hypothetical protein [Capnocytophaga felis]|uniref:Uncharacterized protein n=1 Tax=Capnocytophaga felis TaxID=2267611 RepID=A0A5M4BAZ2_9FLAO|nr:hypothetical protein [Capnocytophaga felis]GET46482.1 hypothetical protein RCZ01_17840 [Capnocytophaga felis]GET48372.1 hypothetical protein RCZ02_12030 [Capnocytophaga felis]
MNNEAINGEQLNNEPKEDTTPVCLHENTHVLTIGWYATCEVTAIFCKDCGKQLSEEQWDC